MHDRAVVDELGRVPLGSQERSDGVVVLCEVAVRAGEVDLVGDAPLGRQVVGADRRALLDDVGNVAKVERCRQIVQENVGRSERCLPLVSRLRRAVRLPSWPVAGGRFVSACPGAVRKRLPCGG